MAQEAVSLTQRLHSARKLRSQSMLANSGACELGSEVSKEEDSSAAKREFKRHSKCEKEVDHGGGQDKFS